MPTRDHPKFNEEQVRRLTSRLGGQLHQLEESLVQGGQRSRSHGEVVEEMARIRADLQQMEEQSRDDPAVIRQVKSLDQRIAQMEETVRGFSEQDHLSHEVHQSLVKEIRESIAQLPELAEQVGVTAEHLPRAPRHLQSLVEETRTPLLSVLGPERQLTATAATLGNRPIDVTLSDQGFAIKERAHVSRIRVKAAVAESGEAGRHMPLEVIGHAPDGRTRVIGSGVTNHSGYLSLNMAKVDLSAYEQIEVNTRTAKTRGLFFDRADLFERLFDRPILFDVPLDVIRRIQERPKDFISIDDPDAEDLVNDPASFSFDAHEHDGSACLKARPEIAVREFHFGQLLRAEEADLVTQDSDDAAIWRREPVTAPVPVRPQDHMGANLSVVGGRIITGKVIRYRQAWQPAAQGLGKLLYSLALAPREEIKLAIIDWRRTERATREDSVSVAESLDADMRRDTTVSDIVSGTIEEEIVGGSSGGASAEATNKPGFMSYLGGAVVGGLIGGPVGMGLGVAAAHFVRPDTGSESESNIDAWNNAVRNISSQAVRQASDVVSQRASAVRDLRSTVVTASEVTEREEVRTRTVRNQNQHHALTIQYYQVLAHYRVVTEAVSEEDVLMVPYAIDHDIFASLPPLWYSSRDYRFSDWTLVRFLLRHQSPLRQALPRHLRQGIDALDRLVHRADSYREPEVSAARWTLMADQSIEPGIDLFLNTDYGRIPLRPLDNSRTQFVSTPVALHRIRGLHFRLDPKVHVEQAMPDVPLPSQIRSGIEEALRERFLRSLEFNMTGVELTAQLQRGRHLRPHASVYTLTGQGSITLSTEQRSATLSLDVPGQPQLRSELLQTTPREADYERVQAAVRWLQQNPMVAMTAIWMTEDPNERALRLDRLSYNGKSLLNLIVNEPLGVDGNYVAFRLAPNLRVLPPIDLSRITRLARVVSVPTSGVFAETYLSCHNATEKRDVTREIDQSKAVPFGAPEIAPIGTGTRSPMQMPTPSTLPSPVVNYQAAPQAPDTAIGSALQGLTVASPFHNLSYGEETMTTIRTLADTAMKVDAEKQAQILDTITELGKVATDAALAAGQAAMGLPPTGGGISGSGGGSGRPSGGGSASAGGTSGTSRGSSGSAPLGGSGVTPEHRAQVGQSLRQSDPASNYDHVKVIEDAVRSGTLSPQRGTAAAENVLGVTGGGHTADAAPTDAAALPPELPTPMSQAALTANPKLVGVIYFHTSEPEEGMLAAALDSQDRAALSNLRQHALFGNMSYRVVGYADSRPHAQGNPAYNDELSYRRALAVAEALFPQDSGMPLYNDEGRRNDAIEVVGAGVDTSAQPGDNPRARRTEIWASAATDDEFVDHYEPFSTKAVLQAARGQLDQDAQGEGGQATRVRARLAKAMLEVYEEGGDLSFAPIGLNLANPVISSDPERWSARDLERAKSSPIERFYQGKIALPQVFLEILPHVHLVQAIHSDYRVDVAARDVVVTARALAQLMMNGHLYHNRAEKMIHWGRSTPGTWAELQNEIARRTALDSPPSIYHRAFDIPGYLEHTETSAQ